MISTGIAGTVSVWRSSMTQPVMKSVSKHFASSPECASSHADKLSDSVRRALLSKQKIAGAEALAQGRFLAPAEIWDADPWLLNTPSGIADLRSGRLEPATADAYCTKMTAVGPDGD